MHLIAKRIVKKDGSVVALLELDGTEIGVVTLPSIQAWGKFSNCFVLGDSQMDGWEFSLVAVKEEPSAPKAQIGGTK